MPVEPGRPGSLTVDALRSYTLADPSGHWAEKDSIRRSKGGVVGTDGVPVVSFRIDHGLDEFFSDIWPLFKERGIPCSVGVVTDAVENPSDVYEPTDTTWATLLAEHKKGFEVWSHSRSHRDPALTGITVESEVVDSKAELEAQGFRPVGWHQPGISGCTTDGYSDAWNGDWRDDYPRFVLGNYALAEMAVDGGASRTIPTEGLYGVGHYTLDAFTSETAEYVLNTNLAFGLSTQWMMHPRYIVGGSVTCTVADVEAFLDAVVALWDAGSIEVLTASGFAFADPNTDARLNLIYNGGFESSTSIPSSGGNPWAYAGGAGTGITVESDGGHSGTKYLHIPASAVYSYVYTGNAYMNNLRAQGATFLCEAWARCTVSDTEARITLIDANDSSRLNYEWYTTLTSGAGWTRLRVPFSVPIATTNLQVRLSRRAGTGDIDFDDVRLVAI